MSKKKNKLVKVTIVAGKSVFVRVVPKEALREILRVTASKAVW